LSDGSPARSAELLDDAGVDHADPSATSAIVHLSGVHKRYRLGNRTVEAARGVDLTISEPGFHAIMGPSGSGKSTLLHLMAGLDRPDAGEVTVAGTRVDSLDERGLTEHRRRRIGIVFQQFNLIPTLTALDNVLLPGVLDGSLNRASASSSGRESGTTVRERGEALLRRLGLDGRFSHRPDALSGGEQQRVAIARALLFAPPVLLADEPTGNLDSSSSEQMWALLEEIAEQERLTVVMVTHEPSAAAHCRQVFVLRDGRVADRFDTEGTDAGELAHRAQRTLGSAR